MSAREERIVTIVDGRNVTLAGTMALISGIRRFDRSTTQVHVLGPRVLGWDRVSKMVSSAGGIAIACDDWPSREGDPYYAKLILAKWASHLAADSCVLYLDYDHVCRAAIPESDTNGDVVHVSSEVHSLASDDPSIPLAAIEELGGVLYNTSLVCARAGVIHRIGQLWHHAYDDLSQTGPRRSARLARHQEEIAFGIAARRAGIRLAPVSLRVQGNWWNPDESGAVFHYGGESADAAWTKLALAGACDGIEPPPDCPSARAWSLWMELRVALGDGPR